MASKVKTKKCPKCSTLIKDSSTNCKKHTDYSKTREARIKFLTRLATGRKGEKHPSWVGDNIEYSAVHKWIRKVNGKPVSCQNALCDKKSKVFEYANITGVYNRDIKNYIQLCKSCHIRLDRWKQEIIIIKQ